MSDRTDDPGRPLRTRRAVLLVAAVVVLAVVVVLVVTLSGRSRTVAPVPSESGSSTAGPAGSTPSASSSAKPTSTGPTRSTGKPTKAKPTGTASSTGGAPTSQPTRSPVPINTKAQVKKGLTAALSQLEAVKGEANGPGEIAGPAIRFVLTLTNTSDAALPLDTLVVNAYYGKAETPASQLEKPGGAALPARVKAAGKATGTFIYSIPTNQRDDVLITVDYSVDVSLIAFRGKVPR
jgi:cytoskeletal protein RodZ